MGHYITDFTHFWMRTRDKYPGTRAGGHGRGNMVESMISPNARSGPPPRPIQRRDDDFVPAGCLS